MTCPSSPTWKYYFPLKSGLVLAQSYQRLEEEEEVGEPWIWVSVDVDRPSALVLELEQREEVGPCEVVLARMVPPMWVCLGCSSRSC